MVGNEEKIIDRWPYHMVHMMNWNVGANAKCIFCDDPKETRDLLFFGCSFTLSLWRKLTQKISGRNTLCAGMCWWPTYPRNRRTKHLHFSNDIFSSQSYSRHMERANARRHGEAPTPQGIMFRCTDKKIQTRHNQG